MQLDSEVLDGLEAFYGVEFGGASMGGWAVGWAGGWAGECGVNASESESLA